MYKNIVVKPILLGTVFTFINMCTAQLSYAKESITVYAAASLVDAMNEITQLYEQKHSIQIKTSYAGSSTLAKQIAAGAPANLFISADEVWMNYLQQRHLISTRKNLLRNQLVLIAGSQQKFQVVMNPSFAPSTVIHGKLCTGDTQSVPVGKYAKSALMQLGWWQQLKPKLVETADTRAALKFVAYGECQAGIVYATDALMSKNVYVVATFPKSTHQPIIYPVGIVKKDPNTVSFYQFLSSQQAKIIFQRYGFSVNAL